MREAKLIAFMHRTPHHERDFLGGIESPMAVVALFERVARWRKMALPDAVGAIDRRGDRYCFASPDEHPAPVRRR